MAELNSMEENTFFLNLAKCKRAEIIDELTYTKLTNTCFRGGVKIEFIEPEQYQAIALTLVET